MALAAKKRSRNADKARNSFVTRRAENKVGALADIFRLASGKNCTGIRIDTLRRTLLFSGRKYLHMLKLVYNWENRFMSVNYNLQMIAYLRLYEDEFKETGSCKFSLRCSQNGIKGERQYSWDCIRWDENDGEGVSKKDGYLSRLSNPLITERLNALDIFEIEIEYKTGEDYWRISCESMIGSATWLLIPPVFSMITPKLDECIKFYEMYELMGDALVNNRF